MKYCTNCQMQVAANSKFCPYCGMELQEQKKTKQKNRKKWNWKYTLAVVAGIVVVIGGIVGYQLIFRLNQDYTTWVTYAENGMAGYKDKDGKIMLEAQYYGAHNFASNGMASVAMGKKHRFLFIDKQGEIMMNGKSFLYAGDFAENGLALVQDDEEKYGYIDETGEYAIASQFVSAGDFATNGLAWVESENGKYSYIDETGKYAFSP